MSGRHVAVAISLPRLELDRPFTYEVPDGAEAPVGSHVSVPFHGRTVKGWVLGPTDDVPKKTLPIRRVLSAVPVFHEADLPLYRWMSERYLAPLAT
ncbi:MAG: primosomal protein N', partial [Actinomycetota bacterium]|nr:primosomal protein N' [Actinomycetota bacterium]